MNEGWYDSAGKLKKAEDLLRPYLADSTQKNSALVAALSKAQSELERNAVLIHEIDRWQRATQIQPKNTKHEVIVGRSAALLQDLDAGLSKVVKAYESSAGKE
mmetsp:Transcript_162/g.344  ORF Transcript_162/g.344 Transcript_162/m.344 type:complete len:103 (-) Transcript_162:289-597(-)